MTPRKWVNKILESTILPEGISKEEVKEKLMPLSKLILRIRGRGDDGRWMMCDGRRKM